MSNVKMTDIAKAAGVSIATVGRVIHNNGYVSEEARVRVEQAVTQLGYVPNRMARALKQKKSRIIGSLVIYNRNDLYQKINQSVITQAEQRGYRILTMEGRQQQRDEEAIIDQFIGMQVDGIVLTSNRFVKKETFARLHQLGIPVVAVERTYQLPFVDNLEVRDFEGAKGAVVNMLRHGHHRVGLIAVARPDAVEQKRRAGYEDALRDFGFAPEDCLMQMVPEYRIGLGYGAMEALLQLPQRPTAVFCTADTLAAGAMQCLYAQRLRVPEDMSIVGYDNVHAAYVSPPIDSVDLAVADIGEKVMTMLEQRMEDLTCGEKLSYLDTVYIDRGTVTPPGAGRL